MSRQKSVSPRQLESPSDRPRSLRRGDASARSRWCGPAIAAASSMMASLPGYATTLYWDGGTVDIVTDGNGVSGGAAGNWDTTLKNWDAGPSAHIAWNNANNDTAAFGRTGVAGGAVTLTAPITVGGLIVYGTGFSVAASTQGLTFGAANNNISLFGSTGTTASATMTGTVGGGGNVLFNSANPVVAGTMTFSGVSAGGWTGTTTINSNMILATTTTSGNVNQVLNSTSGITLNGGTIQFNRATNAQLNAIGDSAPIAVNGGGTFSATSADAGGVNANETIGAVTLNSGQFNAGWTNGGSSGTTLTLSGFTRSGATSAAAFFGPATIANGRTFITGQAPTAANEIIGPWATYGTAVGTQTDYAAYNITGGIGNANGIQGAGIAASAESAWSTTHALASNYTLANASGSAVNGRLTATRNINTLRNSTTATAVTATNATDVINLTGHGFVAGDVVVFGGTTAPTGLNNGQPYYVINPTADTFQVSTTSGGGAALFTGDGTSVNIAGGVTLPSGTTLGTNGILNGSAATLAIGGNGGNISLPTAAPGNLFVTAGVAQIQIDAPIVNPGVGQALTLVKGGSGALALRATNTYTGGTVINAGTVSISNVNHLGGAGANVTFNGNATLTNTTGSTLNFSSGTLTVNQGAVGNLQPGVGSAGITFATTTGSGNLVANLTQNATINIGNASGFTGNLQAKLNGNINQSGAVSLQFSSLADTAGSFLQFGGGQSDSNQSINITFSGTAPLVFNNRRVQMLPRTGSNWIARDSFLANNSAAAANTWTINTDLDWEYTASTNPSSRNFILSGSNTGDNAFNGVISDGNSGTTSLSLQKSGAGRWIVSGNNSFTGATTINAGILQLGSANALGSTSGITMATGSTLRSTSNGITVTAPITTAGSVTIGAPATALGTQAFNEFIVNGAIGGTGNVTFLNTNNVNQIFTVTLGAAGTYSGTTLLDNTAGTAGQIIVKLGVNDALPATTVVTIDGQTGAGTGRVAEINMNGFSQTLAGLTNTARSLRTQRVVNPNNAAAATLTINGPTDSAFSGNLGSNGAGFSLNPAASNAANGNNFGLTKNGAGTFTMTGNNTYSGPTRVLGGILSLGNTSAMSQSPLDTAGSVTGDATNGLRTTVTTVTMGGLTGNKNLADVFTIPSGGYDTVTALTLNPVAGAAPNYTAVIADGAAGMTLAKTGAGTQTLAGTNTYTGATAVNNGTLLVNGSIASSAVTVNGALTGGTNGATLGGSGSISQPVSITDGGVLSPGASLGTLTISAANTALTLADNSTLRFETDPTTPDLVDLTGTNSTVVFGNTLNLNITAFGDPTGQTFTLIDYTSTTDPTLPTTVNFTGAYMGVLAIDDTNDAVILTNVAPVPEPTSIGLVALAGCGLLARRRRPAGQPR